jgi:hypothetical protein
LSEVRSKFFSPNSMGLNRKMLSFIVKYNIAMVFKPRTL